MHTHVPVVARLHGLGEVPAEFPDCFPRWLHAPWPLQRSRRLPVPAASHCGLPRGTRRSSRGAAALGVLGPALAVLGPCLSLGGKRLRGRGRWPGSDLPARVRTALLRGSRRGEAGPLPSWAAAPQLPSKGSPGFPSGNVWGRGAHRAPQETGTVSRRSSPWVILALEPLGGSSEPFLASSPFSEKMLTRSPHPLSLGGQRPSPPSPGPRKALTRHVHGPSWPQMRLGGWRAVPTAPHGGAFSVNPLVSSRA